MIQKSSSVISPLAQIMIIGGGFVLIVAGLRASAEIINILLLAYIITLLAAPIYRRFIRWHLPPFVAVGSVLLVFLILFVGLGVFLASSVGQIQARLLDYESELQTLANTLTGIFSENGAAIFDSMSKSGTFNFQSIISSAFNFVSFLISELSQLFANLGLVILVVFFALFEVTAVPDRLAQGLGAEHHLLQRFYRLNRGIRSYFGIKTLTGLITAVANTVLLLALGVEFAVLWGVLSFLFNYIPNIGFIIALIPAALVALLQFGIGKALIVVVGYVIINFIMDNLLSPRMTGSSVNLSPLVIFIALIFWSWVLGLFGAILAVPFMLILKTVLDSDENARWLSLILSDSAEPHTDPEFPAITSELQGHG